MPRIVSVWLEHWPVTRLRRMQTAGVQGVPDTGPMVVAAMEANGLRLTSVDATASALGLSPGEPLARARARIGTPIAVHPSDPEADAAALVRLCLWAKRYTPTIAAFGPAEGRDGVFLDVQGASHLFGTEADLVADLSLRLAVGGLPARIALADTPGCAFALARHGGGGIVTPGCNAEALRCISVAALRLDPALAQSLARLGLRRIGHLMDASRAALARRFGESLVLRLDQALGLRPEPLVPLDEPHDICATRGFLEPIGRQETIVATATRLMEELTPQLEATGLGARALRLTLTRVDGCVRTLDLAVSVPTRCARQVGRLLDLRLDRLGSALDAGFGFETVSLAVVSTGPMSERQITLVEGPAEVEGPGCLVDALRQRIGPHPLRSHALASHLPERAEAVLPWKPVIGRHIGVSTPEAGPSAKSLSSGTGSPLDPIRVTASRLPPRPLVLLRRGEAVEDVIALVPDGPPQRFRWRRRLHRIIHADGPERIADEWWRGSAPVRDYYVVEDEAGRRLWVYREGPFTLQKPVQWFVHGLFA
ncbi:DNA polymerase Y family protein [Methylobacterium sp. BTF04]|uniref:Y-family DNA polymerase n=1 Tax=Methylobacterium sp. BTF04 TaxID=2708300 RepID=UPI0013D23232|nr:DNA polymerase Y family protein [Methylobacterium sp. BTF04]NEU13307.1 DNA polymerase Y family protein [Methylobacterium sp. BTF04]